MISTIPSNHLVAFTMLAVTSLLVAALAYYVEIYVRTTHFVVPLGPNSSALVVDLPLDSKYNSWHELATKSHYRLPKPNTTSFPGLISLPIPFPIKRGVTLSVQKLVLDHFGVKLKPAKAMGFLGRQCKHPDHPVLRESQFLPHVDGPSEDEIVAVHYLSNSREWPWGGGTGFFLHRSTGHPDVTEDLCLRAAKEHSNSHYVKICLDYWNVYRDSAHPQQEEMVRSYNILDADRDLPGVSGDYGEYNLVKKVDYKPNRIILYPSNVFHAGLMTPEAAANMACSGDFYRTAVTFHWKK